jgi:hypothetical protein
MLRTFSIISFTIYSWREACLLPSGRKASSSVLWLRDNLGSDPGAEVPANGRRARFVGYRPGVEVRWRIGRYAFFRQITVFFTPASS